MTGSYDGITSAKVRWVEAMFYPDLIATPNAFGKFSLARVRPRVREAAFRALSIPYSGLGGTRGSTFTFWRAIGGM